MKETIDQKSLKTQILKEEKEKKNTLIAKITQEEAGTVIGYMRLVYREVR
jgi:hypothetical protein